MPLTRWDIALWIAGDLGYLLLAIVLFVKKRYKPFPWFSALLVSDIVQTIVLATICSPHYPWRYFYAYWTGEMLDAVIRAVVIFEVARAFSRKVGHEPVPLRDLRIASWAIPALTSIAVLFFRFLPDLHTELANLAFKIDTVCALMMFGLVGTVSLSMYFYGLRFKVHAAAIAYGLLLYSVGRLLVFAAALTTAEVFLWQEVERWLKPVYVLTLFVWSVMFWFEEPKTELSGTFVTVLSTLEAIQSAAQPIPTQNRQSHSRLPSTVGRLSGRTPQ